jgi:hypothetical protein
MRNTVAQESLLWSKSITTTCSILPANILVNMLNGTKMSYVPVMLPHPVWYRGRKLALVAMQSGWGRVGGSTVLQPTMVTHVGLASCGEVTQCTLDHHLAICKQ